VLSDPKFGFRERTETLRALAATCRALRQLMHPRLWERLDCVFVPPNGGARYNYAVKNAILKLRAIRIVEQRTSVRLVMR
jgi:hypothetical protein